MITTITQLNITDSLVLPQQDFGPSIVEPCHNLSLEEIVRDYSRGIVHSQREGLYDVGDDVPDIYEQHYIEDSPTFYEQPHNQRFSAPTVGERRGAQQYTSASDDDDEGGGGANTKKTVSTSVPTVDIPKDS